ncbi:DUF6961 family protein [Croceicoccus mobilis]|uniref:Uncharacterized protein n=1 Tax=Croceicoccus mobilis TaxID=1703339 RepID=A0A917DZQ8_9SPHN|nr:hypothetical protein [Croceicoccus mobilis]GGD84481.1 hypothetical protein GCM10010990_38220 [Croceicoccus mobilis]
MSPISDRELWACAAHVLKTHGANAPRHVAERIGALALAGDSNGVATWQAIAKRMAALTETEAPVTRQ